MGAIFPAIWRKVSLVEKNGKSKSKGGREEREKDTEGERERRGEGLKK